LSIRVQPGCAKAPASACGAGRDLIADGIDPRIEPPALPNLPLNGLRGQVMDLVLRGYLCSRLCTPADLCQYVVQSVRLNYVRLDALTQEVRGRCKAFEGILLCGAKEE
jgi:hypothetical protein